MKLRNRGTPIRAKDGGLIMRDEVFDSDRVDDEVLLRRANSFREVGGRPDVPPPQRVTNVPEPDEDDGGPPEFSGTYNVDDCHTGGGWYTLPTGVRKRGREAALDALVELTGQTREESGGGDPD